MYESCKDTPSRSNVGDVHRGGERIQNLFVWVFLELEEVHTGLVTLALLLAFDFPGGTSQSRELASVLGLLSPRRRNRYQEGSVGKKEEEEDGLLTPH